MNQYDYEDLKNDTIKRIENIKEDKGYDIEYIIRSLNKGIKEEYMKLLIRDHLIEDLKIIFNKYQDYSTIEVFKDYIIELLQDKRITKGF